MMCEACERGDHDNCGMQTWCECDCAGYHDVGIPCPSMEGLDDDDDRTMACGHTPEDCDCDPTPEQEAEAVSDEAYWDGDED